MKTQEELNALKTDIKLRPSQNGSNDIVLNPSQKSENDVTLDNLRSHNTIISRDTSEFG